jgi:hypothetical protein
VPTVVSTTNMRPTDSNDTRDPTQHFDHTFEGWSVWIEPCPEVSKNIFDEADLLREQCGSSARGVHLLVPHCTLLYNMNRPMVDRQHEEELGMDLLDQAKQLFRSQGHRRMDNDDDEIASSRMDCPCILDDDDEIMSGWVADEEMTENSNDATAFQVNPTSFYYFHYPKTADSGRGFGCSISMLLLEKSSWLVDLQQAVTAVFPPDERHANGADFIPHMALVYAPECFGEWLKDYTEQVLVTNKQQLLRPFPVKYLSIWSTIGETKDWYRIAFLEM